ncbi:Uncharacterised protein [Serratia fonticola]|nr:Uncharacterised protein [Serratia fonticola]
MFCAFCHGKRPCGEWAFTSRHIRLQTNNQKCDCLQISCDRSVKFCSILVACHRIYKYIQQCGGPSPQPSPTGRGSCPECMDSPCSFGKCGAKRRWMGDHRNRSVSIGRGSCPECMASPCSFGKWGARRRWVRFYAKKSANSIGPFPHRECELPGVRGWTVQLRKVGSENKKGEVCCDLAKVSHDNFKHTRSVPSPCGRGLG